jgi:hypothetical protein
VISSKQLLDQPLLWPLAGAQQPGQPHNYAAQAIASVTADGAASLFGAFSSCRFN